MGIRSFSNGVYMIKSSGLIVRLTNVQVYQDLKNKYWLVTYEYDNGLFPRTLLVESNRRDFFRVGAL